MPGINSLCDHNSDAELVQSHFPIHSRVEKQWQLLSIALREGGILCEGDFPTEARHVPRSPPPRRKPAGVSRPCPTRRAAG